MAKRDIVLNNFSWKLASLILATGVWLTFHSSNNKVVLQMPDDLLSVTGTRTLSNVPISIIKLAGDHREYRLTPTQVDVELGGEASKLRRLMLADLQVFLDLRDGEEGSVMVTVNTPTGVRLERISPLHVNVELVKP
jgi:YbbR domain-containing protein